METLSVGTVFGSGQPWQQQFGFNNATGLGAFTSDGTLPVNLHASSVIVTSSRVFLLGGNNGTATINTIFSAPLIGGSGLNDYSEFYNDDVE